MYKYAERILRERAKNGYTSRVWKTSFSRLTRAFRVISPHKRVNTLFYLINTINMLFNRLDCRQNTVFRNIYIYTIKMRFLMKWKKKYIYVYIFLVFLSCRGVSQSLIRSLSYLFLFVFTFERDTCRSVKFCQFSLSFFFLLPSNY